MFHSNENTRAANGVITDLTRLGATLPDAVADTVQAAKDTQTAHEALLAKGSPDALTALAATRAAGEKVPTEDALDALLGATLAARPEHAEIIQRNAGDTIRAAVAHHSDELIEALRVPFDEAADKINTARTALGNVALDDLEAITALGGDAAAHWKEAKAAEATINSIRMVVQKMVRARAYEASHDRREQALMIADLDFAGFKRIPQVAGAWALSALGTLSLATASEYEARLARVMEAWETDPKNPATRIGPGAGQYPAHVADPVPDTTHAVIGGAL